MNIELKKKLERQAKQTERLMGNYSVGVRKAKGTKFSTNGFWRYNDLKKVSDYKIKSEISKELNSLYNV